MYFYILISIICYSFEILCYDNEILLKNKECFNIENELEFDYDKNGYKILKGNLKIYYSDVYQNFINISNILKNIFNRNNISYISISGIKNSIQFEFNFLKYGNEFEMMINIDLFNCDEFLRYYYNLTKEDTLFISQLFILDLNNEKRFLLKYIIYDNNQVLNLNICDQNKKYLKIVYPLSLLNLNNEYYRLVKHLSQKKINILNKNEPFYNDICFSFSFNNKDISIDDRRKLFFKNFSICEGCSFSDINYNKNQILCLCSYNMEYNFDKPFEKISFINFKIMKCYHNFFNIKLFKNIGFYIELSFLIISIVFEIHWYYFSSSLINNKILKILSKRSNKNSIKNKIFSKRNLVNFTMKTQSKLTLGINSSNLLLQSNLDFSKNTISENSKLSLNKSIIQTVVNAPSEINNITIINNNSILEKKSTIHRCVNIEENNSIKEKKDNNTKKKFILIYWDLLKIHNSVFNLFFYKFKFIPDSSKFIYITNSINLLISFTVIFYFPTYIHENYLNKSSIYFLQFIFKYHYQKVLYCILIHFIISFPLSLLSFYNFSNADYLFSNEKQKIIHLIHENKIIKRKISVFFSISSIVNVLSLYYISIFCIIYEKTQYIFLLLSLFTFLIQNLLSILILLIICIVFLNSNLNHFL